MGSLTQVSPFPDREPPGYFQTLLSRYLDIFPFFSAVPASTKYKMKFMCHINNVNQGGCLLPKLAFGFTYKISLFWNVKCKFLSKKCCARYNQAPYSHGILKHQAPTHRLKLYVRAVIESEA